MMNVCEEYKEYVTLLNRKNGHKHICWLDIFNDL